MKTCILSPAALKLIRSKRDDDHQIVCGVLLIFFQKNAAFPKEVDSPSLVEVIQHIRDMLMINPSDNQGILEKCFEDTHRTIRQFKQEIRFLFGFRGSTEKDKETFIVYCKTTIFPTAPTWEQAIEQAYVYLESQKIEPYSEKQINRFLTTAHHQFEVEFFEQIERCLSPHTKQELDLLVPLNDEDKLDPNANEASKTLSCESIKAGNILVEKPLDPLKNDEGISFGSEESLQTPSVEGSSNIEPSGPLKKAANTMSLAELKSQQVELKIDSILCEIQKYNYLKSIKIPTLIECIGTRKLFFKYYERVLAEPPSSLKQHKSSIRYAYLAMFCVIRQQIMTDTLVDLLLKLLHRILTRAETAVDKALRLDNKRVKGKMGTLLVLAKQSIDHPTGVIQDTIYPTVPKDRLSEIVSELGEDNQWYQNKVKTKALSLYSHTHRRIVWALMDVLEFQTDSQLSKIIKALDFMKRVNAADNPLTSALRDRLYDPILLKNTIPDQWLPFVTIQADITATKPLEPLKTLNCTEESSQPPSQERDSDSAKIVVTKTSHPTKFKINWNALELSLFERLRDELSVKNIWVNKAFRYRNPGEDLPSDFDENEDHYFALLGLPKDAAVFLSHLKQRLDNSLSDLNASILDNLKVSIKDRKKKGAIKVTPFEPQKEPQNLDLLKAEIAKLWPHVHLIDILKEADFRIGFTKRFESVASREAIDSNDLQKRLLLCVFGIGSNIGLKRMSGLGEGQELYENLRYVKRRFINGQNIRLAIQDVINAILKIRDPKIWGVSTTCAADSKKISVWDQNLLVEWHARYGGRGVMIYWHVDKKGLCIHSKLKTCSSSEVGSMILGILYHDSLMDVCAVSVDTQGQSAIGFAFSELFQFDLLPRIKNINKQKLYCSSKTKKGEYPNLTDALASDTLQWKKIEQSSTEKSSVMLSLLK